MLAEFATLKIIELAIKTYIGVYEWEQEIQQTVLIDLEFKLQLNNITEDLNSTVDYAAITALLVDKISNNKFKLIENLAQYIRDLLQNTYSITPSSIRVHKPNAIRNAKDIFIEIGDYYLGMEALKKHNRIYSLDEARKECGLED